MAFWTCPACRRRVPGYVAVCHCGVQREAASALTARAPSPADRRGEARFDWRDLTWPIWAALAVMLVAFVFGLWQLSKPQPPPRRLPLIAIVDPIPVVTPTPSPSPRPSRNVSQTR